MKTPTLKLKLLGLVFVIAYAALASFIFYRIMPPNLPRNLDVFMVGCVAAAYFFSWQPAVILYAISMGIAVSVFDPEEFGNEFRLAAYSASTLGLVFAIAFLKNTAERLRESEAKYRRLNEELEKRVSERTAELELANQELSKFSYSVSHDLRSPLRALDGFSQILIEDYEDRLDESGRDYLNRIRAASQRMGELIDALLNLSRVSRADLKRERIDLSAIAHAAADELLRASADRRISFKIAGGMIDYGDARLVRQLLDNLLGNAWKFTSRRAEARIEFACDGSNGERVYFVRDNGAGFDMEYAGKLFGAFQRLHGAGEFEGTGIGLATVQRIIHRHGGRVWAEGAVEKGATFYFTLGAGQNETSDDHAGRR